MHLQLIVIQSQPQAEITPSSMTSPGFYSLFRATEDIIQLFLFTGWVVQLVMSKTRHSHLTTSNISQSNLQKIYYTYLDMRFFFLYRPTLGNSRWLCHEIWRPNNACACLTADVPIHNHCYSTLCLYIENTRQSEMSDKQHWLFTVLNTDVALEQCFLPLSGFMGNNNHPVVLQLRHRYHIIKGRQSYWNKSIMEDRLVPWFHCRPTAEMCNSTEMWNYISRGSGFEGSLVKCHWNCFVTSLI